MNEKEIYQKGLKAYGESPMALHWVNYRSMAIRFKNLVRDIDFEGKSILDAGCGMGDLLPFIYARANHFDYLGADINEGFIEIAKKRYEGHLFEVANPFDPKYKGNFDIVLSSGVMNINVKDWQEHRRTMIEHLFALTHQTLAFNMAGSKKPATSDPLIAYANADEIADFCRTIAKKVELRTDYLAHDFTVVMSR